MAETDDAGSAANAPSAGAPLFLLGVRSADVLPRLPADGLIYTTALADEAQLLAAGFRARYLYRHPSIFSAAASMALDWLATIRMRAKAAGGPSDLLFGDSDDPVWAMSYDALFETKDGVFDGILHTLLARELSTGHPDQIQIYATLAHPMAIALQQRLGSRAVIDWRANNLAAPPAVQGRTIGRIVRRGGNFLVQCALLGLRRVLARSKGKRAALVGISGEMSRTYRDSLGRQRHSDLYYENLEPALEAALTDIVTVGINPPRLSRSGPGASFDYWRMILSGAHSPWYGYASAGAIWRLLRDRRRYAAILDAAHADPRFADLFVVDGLSFYKLVQPRIDSMLPGLLASARFHAAIARRFVAREDIGLIVSVESFSSMGRCMAAALHGRGGALWGIQGGIISPARVTNSGFYTPALGGQSHLEADRFLVWGPAYRDLLTRFGINPARLQVMGFNRAKALPKRDSARLGKQVLYLTGGNAVVCPYLMTMEEEDHTLQVLAASMPPGSELVIRVHPRHDAAALRRRLAGKRVTIVSASDMSLDQSLAAADVVVAKASTVLLEAASAGKAVLMINLAGTPDFTGFSTGTATLPYCEDAASLRPMLARLLDDQDMDAARSRFAAAWCVGTAADAAAHLTAALAGTADLPR